jgi:hypothetical protein
MLPWFPGRAREPAWEGDRFHGRHRRQGRFPRRSAKRDAFCCTRGAFHRCAAPFERGLSPALDPGLGSCPHVVPNLWSVAAGAFAFRACPTAVDEAVGCMDSVASALWLRP